MNTKIIFSTFGIAVTSLLNNPLEPPQHSLESKWISLHAHFHGSLALFAVLIIQAILAVAARAVFAGSKAVAVEFQALWLCTITWTFRLFPADELRYWRHLDWLLFHFLHNFEGRLTLWDLNCRTSWDLFQLFAIVWWQHDNSLGLSASHDCRSLDLIDLRCRQRDIFGLLSWRSVLGVADDLADDINRSLQWRFILHFRTAEWLVQNTRSCWRSLNLDDFRSRRWRGWWSAWVEHTNDLNIIAAAGTRRRCNLNDIWGRRSLLFSDGDTRSGSNRVRCRRANLLGLYVSWWSYNNLTWAR